MDYSYFCNDNHNKCAEMPQIRFAIIDSNILVCLGLQHLICDLLPMAEVVICESYDELVSQDNSDFLHYFVSSRIYFEHSQFFREHPRKSIVLVNGDMMISNVYTLNVCQSQKSLVRDIMSLQSKGHSHAIRMARDAKPDVPLLSSREIEVAVLLCRGCINKEIADRLNVSVTTVMTHRKNIMEKLRARSLADIILHCVVNGIVAMEEL